MNVCTVVTRSYLAQARVLARSFLEQHPHGTITALLLDDLDRTVDGEPFEVIRPEDLDLGTHEFNRMAAMYEARELACAMKVWVIRHVLDTRADAVLYLDSDGRVFGSLVEALDLAASHALVLTPMLAEPVPPPPESWEEDLSLTGGVYNAGCLGASSSARSFLEWWAKRTARDCLLEPEHGYYMDQRWLDLVPAYFDHHVLRDPAYNVALWNVGQRDLQNVGGKYTVGDSPLRYFHFSAYNPEEWYVLNRSVATSRRPVVLLSRHPALAQLCRDYVMELNEHGYQELRSLPYAFGALSNGVKLDRRMRRIYRGALLTAEEQGTPEPPNPFHDGADAFVDWLREPPGRRRSSDNVSRYLTGLRDEQSDLRRRFPDLRADGRRFLDWVTSEERSEEIPAELMPVAGPTAAALPRVVETAPGINLIVRHRGGGTLEELAPRILDGLAAQGVPVARIAWDEDAEHEDDLFLGCHPLSAPYDTNLLCLNPIDLASFAFHVPAGFFAARYSIGIWLDQEASPKSVDHPLSFLDEVWVASEFAADGLRSRTTKTVRVVPFPIDPPPVELSPREKLGLPEGHLVLSLVDFGGPFASGDAERSNPFDVVEAFQGAFAPGEGAVLLVRSRNGEAHLDELERLRLVSERDDVVFIDGELPAEKRHALIAACDCFVSLHRAVEFGVPLAEAMAAGKPVVATSFSGNLDYMSQDDSYLATSRPVSTPSDYAAYWTSHVWAEPDLEEAATMLRRVVEDPDEAREKGDAARERLRAGYSRDRCASFVVEQLDRIQSHSPDPLPEQSVDSASDAAPASLQRAIAYVGRGPENTWTAPSRFGVAGKLARRALLRAMRPYLERRAELDAAVVAALADLNHRQVQAEVRLEELAEHVPGLRRDSPR